MLCCACGCRQGLHKPMCPRVDAGRWAGGLAGRCGRTCFVPTASPPATLSVVSTVPKEEVPGPVSSGIAAQFSTLAKDSQPATSTMGLLSPTLPTGLWRRSVWRRLGSQAPLHSPFCKRGLTGECPCGSAHWPPWPCGAQHPCRGSAFAHCARRGLGDRFGKGKTMSFSPFFGQRHAAQFGALWCIWGACVW